MFTSSTTTAEGYAVSEPIVYAITKSTIKSICFTFAAVACTLQANKHKPSKTSSVCYLRQLSGRHNIFFLLPGVSIDAPNERLGAHTAFAHFAGTVTINLLLLTRVKVNVSKWRVVQCFTWTAGAVHAWSISGIWCPFHGCRWRCFSWTLSITFKKLRVGSELPTGSLL